MTRLRRAECAIKTQAAAVSDPPQAGYSAITQLRRDRRKLNGLRHVESFNR